MSGHAPSQSSRKDGDVQWCSTAHRALPPLLKGKGHCTLLVRELVRVVRTVHTVNSKYLYVLTVNNLHAFLQYRCDIEKFSVMRAGTPTSFGFVADRGSSADGDRPWGGHSRPTVQEEERSSYSTCTPNRLTIQQTHTPTP